MHLYTTPRLYRREVMAKGNYTSPVYPRPEGRGYCPALFDKSGKPVATAISTRLTYISIGFITLVFIIRY
jgi:hypothetical protein